MSGLAPIVLFVYNRPQMLRQALRSLKENKLVSHSELIIFCDGPKENVGDEEMLRIEEVRKMVRQIDWCSGLHIREQPRNRGLADSVISGLDEVFQKYRKAIVVEDDVELSPFFLDYMNKALDLYENDPRILSVGSWNYFSGKAEENKDYFFFRYPDSIAWGTWKRGWSGLMRDAKDCLEKLRDKQLINRFSGDGTGTYFLDMLNMQIEGKVNSWAIRWTATSVIHNRLNIFPQTSMSKHIGFGPDSTHERSTVDYNAGLELADKMPELLHESSPSESMVAFKAWKSFVRKHFIAREKPTIFDTLRSRLCRLRKKIRTGTAAVEFSQIVKEAAGFPRYRAHRFKFREFTLEVTDFLSVAHQLKEFFDEERLKFKSHTATPRILDCGSNVGISVLYFLKLYPGARITGFEPDQDVFRCLEANLRANGASQVELFQAAVWTHDRGVEFSAEGADGGSIHGSENRKHVPSLSLREILAAEAEVDLLKMDIEGAETEVLLDSESGLLKVKRLFVEYHSLAGRRQELDKLLQLLSRCGFRYHIHPIGQQAPRPFLGVNSYNGMDLQLDIYAFREN